MVQRSLGGIFSTQLNINQEDVTRSFSVPETVLTSKAGDKNLLGRITCNALYLSLDYFQINHAKNLSIVIVLGLSAVRCV